VVEDSMMVQEEVTGIKDPIISEGAQKISAEDLIETLEDSRTETLVTEMIIEVEEESIKIMIQMVETESPETIEETTPKGPTVTWTVN